MKILVTGGAGFIGSALVRMLIEESDVHVVNVDKLTYAGNTDSVQKVAGSPRYSFVKADICDHEALTALFNTMQPDVVVHLAAETHVDRSIDGPAAFVQTNVLGTYTLLEAARAYYSALSRSRKKLFRFHHVSTDEVYGTLGPDGSFEESTPYAPRSPYSASKASSDHLVRAWYHTYELPIIITNSSNNYGPYQFPEKLIPLMILNGIEEKPMPVYGSGENVRDWLYVEDHVRAIWIAATMGKIGETYNIGGEEQLRNIDVTIRICDILDDYIPPKNPRQNLITFVTDRPGHDARYAINSSKMRQELGWQPKECFESGLRKTVLWYLKHPEWWQNARGREYKGDRLGLLPFVADTE